MQSQHYEPVEEKKLYELVGELPPERPIAQNESKSLCFPEEAAGIRGAIRQKRGESLDEKTLVARRVDMGKKQDRLFVQAVPYLPLFSAHECEQILGDVFSQLNNEMHAKKLKGGSTACVALTCGREVIVFNLGDSQAGIVVNTRDGKVQYQPLTTPDHVEALHETTRLVHGGYKHTADMLSRIPAMTAIVKVLQDEVNHCQASVDTLRRMEVPQLFALYEKEEELSRRQELLTETSNQLRRFVSLYITSSSGCCSISDKTISVTRALGDEAFEGVGLSHTPRCTHKTLGDDVMEACFVIGSDGFLDDNQAREAGIAFILARETGSLSKKVDAAVQQAAENNFKKRYEDDISVIVQQLLVENNEARLCCIFDGHDTSDVADYAAKNIGRIFWDVCKTVLQGKTFSVEQADQLNRIKKGMPTAEQFREASKTKLGWRPQVLKDIEFWLRKFELSKNDPPAVKYAVFLILRSLLQQAQRDVDVQKKDKRKGVVNDLLDRLSALGVIEQRLATPAALAAGLMHTFLNCFSGTLFRIFPEVRLAEQSSNGFSIMVPGVQPTHRIIQRALTPAAPSPDLGLEPTASLPLGSGEEGDKLTQAVALHVPIGIRTPPESPVGAGLQDGSESSDSTPSLMMPTLA
ncbi:MAG: hypothetical protein A2X77_00180 [Gammaproteobacteria bacterium GWE2_42_36]|nr:MAG: hypothetical protein A2X77_00180 [Gammaproteobacteria bacterium GWE2_42_36]HCU05192.1 hypothetical protein [Coxiellaceae bacterium]